MKNLTLRCCKCKREWTIRGKNVKEIMRAVDKAGWRDTPEGDWCPDCDKKADQEGLGGDA